MHVVKLLAIVVPTFLILDLTWLGIVMKSFYSAELGELARRQGTALAPRWGAAILVYLLIPGGLILFVRPHLGASATLPKAFGWGALYALIVYGVYDLTNRAVLEQWSLRMTVADIAWGTTLCGAVSVIMHLADDWLST